MEAPSSANPLLVVGVVGSLLLIVCQHHDDDDDDDDDGYNYDDDDDDVIACQDDDGDDNDDGEEEGPEISGSSAWIKNLCKISPVRKTWKWCNYSSRHLFPRHCRQQILLHCH